MKHGVHPNQISQWKAQAIAGMADLFERPNKKSEETRKQEEEKDFNLLMKIKEVQIEHPYYGYRRIWCVFNTMDALQYASLLRETIEEYGCPAIFNTDQGSQFTSILNATKQ